MRSPIKFAFLSVVIATAGTGCLGADDNRCSPGEVLDSADSCVCAPGHVPVYRDITVLAPASPTEARPFSACVACGTNEVVSGDKCACATGFVRGAAGCVASKLGAPCASDADCATGDQPSCRLPEGYCTKTPCASNADCDGEADYACATTATPPYCKRPPLGQGQACTMAGPDPACSTEAPLCALGACLVSGCQTDADCSPSRKCCDLSHLGQAGLTLCLTGVCP